MESCTNYNLQVLVDTLNKKGIKSIGIDYSKLKIFYNEENKEIIFNLINEIKTKKSGLTFTKENINNESIKSVTIDFRSKISTNVDLIQNFINYPTITDITNYLNMDSIMDYYASQDINCTIQDNQEFKNNYLVTLETISKDNNIDFNSFIISNNLQNNLIHTICKPEQNNKYKVLYRLLYETEEELYSLLPSQRKVKKRTL